MARKPRTRSDEVSIADARQPAALFSVLTHALPNEPWRPPETLLRHRMACFPDVLHIPFDDVVGGLALGVNCSLTEPAGLVAAYRMRAVALIAKCAATGTLKLHGLSRGTGAMGPIPAEFFATPIYSPARDTIDRSLEVIEMEEFAQQVIQGATSPRLWTDVTVSRASLRKMVDGLGRQSVRQRQTRVTDSAMSAFLHSCTEFPTRRNCENWARAGGWSLASARQAWSAAAAARGIAPRPGPRGPRRKTS
jgi:hypothetical protein